jgi:biotin synthase-related radical SAM superfamily protein
MAENANKCFVRGLPELIRVSVGTAIVLGLTEGKLDAKPTTAYLMTYRVEKCTANCGFCPQARESKSNSELLSRVSWPAFPTLNVLATVATAAKEGKINRVCVQSLNYPDVVGHLESIVKEIKKRSIVAISVSCQPVNRDNIVRLAKSGVNRLGIALDAASEAIFDRVKGKDAGGKYVWQNQFLLLNQALDIFGEDNVSTHVIVGLGETERDAVKVIQRCVDMGVLPALFAFTPVRGTALEKNPPPKVKTYRRLQLARYLIVTGKTRAGDMQFDADDKITGYGLTNEALNWEIEGGLPFQTSGCPDCNRPFYNEKPSGPIYNYPTKLSKKEVETVKKQLFS